MIKICFFVAAILLNTEAFAQVRNLGFGANDARSAEIIRKINSRATLRSMQSWDELERNLREAQSVYRSNSFALARVQNELADVYSNNILDVERALEVDQALGLAIDMPVSEGRKAEFLPVAKAANNAVIEDEFYFDQFVSVSDVDLKAAKTKRMQINSALLQGQIPPAQTQYSLQQLKEFKLAVESDFDSVAKASAAHRSLLSRYLKVDALMQRLGGTPPFAYRKLVDGELIVEGIDFSEISFLELSAYLLNASATQQNVRLAELALQVIYKPYANLRSPNARWLYNNIVNGYIDQLVKANFEAGRYDEALYYASLNKSRAVLEERLIYEQIKGGANTRLADLYAQDSVPRDKSGLPAKDWFRQQMAKAPAYLDFYVSGQFEEGKGKAASSRQATTVARAERAVMPMNARDFGVEGTTAAATGSFQDTGMYVFQVNGGKVQSARRVAGAELARLKGELNTAFDQVSGAGPSSRNARALLSAYANGMPERYAVSADKWLSRHPLEMHLNAKVSRTLNFFTLSEPTRLSKLSVAGFFDPLNNLSGSRAEADVIEAVVPGSVVRKGDQATVGELKNVRGASVVHLSMHGFFDEQNPSNSKLAFAGAREDAKPGDPNALYAKDIVGFEALRNRDLVFAAACKSGVVASDSANQNELMGILRPLTANRNRNVILSLWNVNDASAKDFVEAFYRSLGNSLNVDEAFFAAQSKVREKYRDPYHWAAFYLSKAN